MKKNTPFLNHLPLFQRPCILFIILAFAVIGVQGCISIPLSSIGKENEPPITLEMIHPPPQSFSLIERQKQFITLKSRDTGNIIFLRSQCPKTHDTLVPSIIESMEQVEISQDPQPLTINDRKAQRQWIRGTKENLIYRIEIIQFEKYSCQNSLVYLSQEKFFDNEIQSFHKILSSVRVTP